MANENTPSDNGTGRKGRDYLSTALFIVCVVFTRFWAPMLDPVWEASGGEPAPRNFRYLMFPPSDGASVLQDSNGAHVGSLPRAVLVSDEDVDRSKSVGFGGERAKLTLNPSDLRFVPPPGAAIDYAGDWASQTSEVPGTFYACAYSLKPRADGKFDAVLKYSEGSKGYKFKYITDGRTATPLEMYRRGGEPELFGWWSLSFFAALTITVQVVAAGLLRFTPRALGRVIGRVGRLGR